MKKLLITLLASLSALGAARAQTIENGSGQAYVGIGAARSSIVYEGGHKTGAKLFGGYDFNQNLGIEAGYTRFGSVGATYEFATEQYRTSTRGNNSYVAGKYTVPINERFSAYGKLGLSHTVRNYQAIGYRDGYRESENGVYAGLGAKYKLNQNVSLNVEYEKNGSHKTFGPSANQWSLGISYGF
jgi:opacity protein-like surface antigen